MSEPTRYDTGDNRIIILGSEHGEIVIHASGWGCGCNCFLTPDQADALGRDLIARGAAMRANHQTPAT